MGSDLRPYCSFAYSALGFLQNGDVRVGVFPECEENLICLDVLPKACGLLEIADEDHVAALITSRQQQLLAIARPGEIEDKPRAELGDL